MQQDCRRILNGIAKFCKKISLNASELQVYKSSIYISKSNVLTLRTI